MDRKKISEEYRKRGQERKAERMERCGNDSIAVQCRNCGATIGTPKFCMIKSCPSCGRAKRLRLEKNILQSLRKTGARTFSILSFGFKAETIEKAAKPLRRLMQKFSENRKNYRIYKKMWQKGGVKSIATFERNKGVTLVLRYVVQNNVNFDLKADKYEEAKRLYEEMRNQSPKTECPKCGKEMKNSAGLVGHLCNAHGLESRASEVVKSDNYIFRKIGEKLSLSRNTVKNWIRNEYKPRTLNLFKNWRVSEGLGTEEAVHDLMDGVIPPKIKTPSVLVDWDEAFYGRPLVNTFGVWRKKLSKAYEQEDGVLDKKVHMNCPRCEIRTSKKLFANKDELFVPDYSRVTKNEVSVQKGNTRVRELNELSKKLSRGREA